jgi:hypothetical protein
MQELLRTSEELIKSMETIPEAIIKENFKLKIYKESIIQQEGGNELDRQYEEYRKLLGQEKSVYIDQLLALKGVSTDFILSEFLPAEKNAFFIKVITESMNKVLDSYFQMKGFKASSENTKDDKFPYKDYYCFIYKGGNILRSIFNSYLKTLPQATSNIIEEYYKDILSKSDADFQIMINPKIENYQEIYDDILKICYIVLNRLRNYFLKNLDKCFEYFSKSETYKKEALTKLLLKMNDATDKLEENNKYVNYNFIGVSFIDTIVWDNDISDDIKKNLLGLKTDFFRRNDTYIKKKNVDNVVIARIKSLTQKNYSNHKSLNNDFIDSNKLFPNLSTYTSPMYVSYNERVQINLSYKNMSSEFGLVRTKMLFKFFYYDNATDTYGVVPIPGELIDLSIYHPVSFENNNIIWDDFIKHDITKYDINVSTYSGVNIEYPLIAYSDEYFMKDFNKMMFVQTDDIFWNVKKAKKRLKRVIFLSILELFKPDFKYFRATDLSHINYKYITHPNYLSNKSTIILLKNLLTIFQNIKDINDYYLCSIAILTDENDFIRKYLVSNPTMEKNNKLVLSIKHNKFINLIYNCFGNIYRFVKNKELNKEPITKEDNNKSLEFRELMILSLKNFIKAYTRNTKKLEQIKQKERVSFSGLKYMEQLGGNNISSK